MIQNSDKHDNAKCDFTAKSELINNKWYIKQFKTIINEFKFKMKIPTHDI